MWGPTLPTNQLSAIPSISLMARKHSLIERHGRANLPGDQRR